MHVLHLSESDVDNGGARAAYRLHQGLRSIGCHSQMLVRAKFGTDPSVVRETSLLTKISPPLSGLPMHLYPKRPGGIFSMQWVPDVLAQRVKQFNPDIVHIHAVCNGYLQIETLRKFHKPLVWTLHDMWPFTGGCHYNQDCDHYQKVCGACPQLGSNHRQDFSHWTWKRKINAWKDLDLTLVATTSWMAECARSSSLFQDTRIEIISLGLDTDIYKPHNRHFAREVLSLPQEKHLVLFGAINGMSDRRKGFHLLQPALQRLSQSGWQDQIELVIFGSSQPEQAIELGFKTHYVGRLNDDLSLALVYSAADVMVVPSVQEAFGQTASEAQSCGTPVVAFNATGVKDVVDHQQTGYLAIQFEEEDLAKGIVWALENQERHRQLRCHAREKGLRDFSSRTQANHYMSLYTNLIEERK
ncbi:glycosyl transferase [filamentous cyanobacterium CCT1]|nr:glycosyl transferase [filamentous cyanobacterium CCT1]PSN81111.1 glycosyl transferase [filamentous cyanobacterium CCP4]